ncbi:DNA polymerase III subunit chi [Pigmentiphaga sp. CHJ604]|uniref:DNA polymerase III subunit chi n=1 Tax=Pigmentiphaga sp. CHJ604 TaxID=3081984 RepID=UPI0030D32DC4
MAAIHFSFNAADRLRAACLIAERRYRAGDPLLVYCSDVQRLEAFDVLLWEYEPAAFVPHVFADDALAHATPIVLHRKPPANGSAWILNLDDGCVPGPDRFANIVEVVSRADDERQRGRARWREYQRAGHSIVQHDLAQNQLP